MIVSFKSYVINFVDFVLNCYSHITSHVSQAFTGFTHYTSYSLLNIVHVIVCVFGLSNQVCKYIEFLSKTDLMFENLWRMFETLFLGKLGLKLVFLKNFASHTHAVYSYFSMLGGFNAKTGLFFFKTMFFLEFQSTEAIFQSIEIYSKFFGEPLSISINRNWFSINWKSWIRFFKNWVWLVQTHFLKVFRTFLFLSDSAKAHPQFFVVFVRSFCKVFLSPSW